MKKFLTVIML